MQCAVMSKESDARCDKWCQNYRNRLRLLCPDEASKVIPMHCPGEASNKKET